MVFNRKELERVAESIEAMQTQMREADLRQEKRLQAIEDALSRQDKALADIIESRSGVLREFDSASALLRERAEDMRKRADSFRILENKVSKKLLEEARDVIASRLESVSDAVREYGKAADALSQVSSSVDSSRREMERLSAIAGKLTPADFELARFAREVAKADTEKLRLMRENERLKNLVAKMRRSR